jgi:hypothetical protein
LSHCSTDIQQHPDQLPDQFSHCCTYGIPDDNGTYAIPHRVSNWRPNFEPNFETD